MRFLFLNHNVAFRGGGTFFRAWHLARALGRRGHSTDLVASGEGGWGAAAIQEDTASGGALRLVQLGGLLPVRWRFGYDPYETLARIRWVRQQCAVQGPYDIVHAFDSRPVVIYPALQAQQMGSRLVMDWCDWFGRGGASAERKNPVWRWFMDTLDTWYEERFRTRADASTVINSALDERARRLGVGEPILRLPNGADIASITPRPQAEARRRLGLGDGLWVGYLGSLFQRDADLLIDAIQQVQERVSNVHLALIGQPKATIPPMAGVQRTGYVSDEALPDWLAACDVLCLPMQDTLANRGRLPFKLCDYFAAGRAVAVCDVGDVGEMVRSAGAGLACPPTAAGLAEALAALLLDPARRQVMGIQARQAAETQYNWDIVARDLETLYEQVRAR